MFESSFLSNHSELFYRILQQNPFNTNKTIGSNTKNVCNNNSIINKSETVLLYSHNQKFSTYDNIRGVTLTAILKTSKLSSPKSKDYPAT